MAVNFLKDTSDYLSNKDPSGWGTSRIRPAHTLWQMCKAFRQTSFDRAHKCSGINVYTVYTFGQYVFLLLPQTFTSLLMCIWMLIFLSKVNSTWFKLSMLVEQLVKINVNQRKHPGSIYFSDIAIVCHFVPIVLQSKCTSLKLYL